MWWPHACCNDGAHVGLGNKSRTAGSPLSSEGESANLILCVYVWCMIILEHVILCSWSATVPWTLLVKHHQLTTLPSLASFIIVLSPHFPPRFHMHSQCQVPALFASTFATVVLPFAHTCCPMPPHCMLRILNQLVPECQACPCLIGPCSGPHPAGVEGQLSLHIFCMFHRLYFALDTIISFPLAHFHHFCSHITQPCHILQQHAHFCSFNTYMFRSITI